MKIKSRLNSFFYIVVAIFIIMRLTSYSVLSQTNTATSSSDTITPTISLEEKDIQNLKEKIATKVAELRAQNNKAVSGFVTKVDKVSFTIQGDNSNAYTIKLDEALTKYYQVAGTQIKEQQYSYIKQGMFAIVTGVASDNIITANNVYIDEKFLVLSGSITNVNQTDYSLKVTTTDKDAYILNIETTTKQEMLNIKTLDIEKAGFSKIKEGDTIHFVVKKTGNEKDNTFKATKILIIPQEYFIQ